MAAAGSEPMNRSEIIGHVEALLADRDPPPAVLRWLKMGFQRHITYGEPLAVALGVARHCPQGLSFALRNARFAECLHRAVDALNPAPNQSAHSIAKLIGGELARLARRQRPRPPSSDFEAALLDALAVHPNAPTAISSLWPLVHAAIAKRPVQTVELQAEHVSHQPEKPCTLTAKSSNA
jgi:hypothetical protein